MKRKQLGFGALLLAMALQSQAMPGPVPLAFLDLTTNVQGMTAMGATNSLNAVASDGTNFVTVGTNSTILFATTNVVGGFIHGLAWTKESLTNGTILNLAAVTYGSGKYVFGGDNSLVFSSSNGTIWPAQSNGPTAFSPYAIGGVAFNGGTNPTFQAVAEASQIDWAPPTNLSLWTGDTIDGKVFVESYRAVTPFGANGFAACGVFGVIRTNSGNNTWDVSGGNSWSSGSPGYYGIVWDGNQTLVAVGGLSGSGGSILVSTNNGTTWSNAFWVDPLLGTNGGANGFLNAVAYYIGNGFVAVGANGTVITSPNGLAWTYTNVASESGGVIKTNLVGVAFATSGPLQGVALLVGAGGTVIVGGTPPTAFGGSNTIICNGQTTNITANFGGSRGPWNVTWSDGVTITNATTPFTRMVTPTNTDLNHPTNITYTVTSIVDAITGITNAAGGLTSTNVITVNPRPSSTLTPATTTTNCNLGATNLLTITLNGTGPWTFQLSSNGSILPAMTVGPSGPGPFTTNITEVPTNTQPNSPYTNVYFIAPGTLSDANFCFGSNLLGDIVGTNTVVINPLPTATVMVSVNPPQCNYGTPYTNMVTLTGIGPWTVNWNDGSPPQVTNGAAPLTIPHVVIPTNAPGANAVSNNLYFVTSLMDANCTADATKGGLKGTNIVPVNPRPTATVTVFANLPQCNYGTSYTNMVTLTGIGPWTVNWNDGSPAQVTNGAAPLTIPHVVIPTNAPMANAVSNNLYFVTSLTDSNCMADATKGDIKGTNSVPVNPRPTSMIQTSITTNCNYGTNSFSLTNILTGIGPWTVIWSSNTTLVTQTVNVATNGPFTNVFPFLVAPIEPNTNAPYTNVYFVQSVSNSATGCAGSNLLNDLVGTNTVVINPRPTATVTASGSSTCNGAFYTNLATLTGVGPWSVVWSSNGVQLPPMTVGILNQSGPVTNSLAVMLTNALGVSTQSNNVFFVLSVSNTGTQCVGSNLLGDIKGTNSVLVNPLPTATLTPSNFVHTNCNDGTTYTFTNTITAFGAWGLMWNDGTPQTGSGPGTVTRTVMPGNTNANGITPQVNLYFVSSMTNAGNCAASSLLGTNKIVVNPVPQITITNATLTNCAGFTNPTFTVSVFPASADINWLNAITMTNIAAHTNSYTPTNGIVNGTNVWQFTVQATITNNTPSCSSNLTVTLVLTNCPILSRVPGTNQVKVGWYGSLELQSATNLGTNALLWTNVVSNGTPGMLTNVTFTNSPPPTNRFFRLFGPHN